MVDPASTLTLRLAEASRAPAERHFAPDDAARAAIAKTLDFVALPALTADLTVKPWFDGVQIDGAWQAIVVQTCGVTLEDFATPLSGDFMVRVVPPSSPHAPSPTDEVVIDLEADDPPDVLETDAIDLSAYVVEHLALEIDPFPRKPDAVFEPPASEPESSPFSVLRLLKPGEPTH